jgi:hypothetical protein
MAAEIVQIDTQNLTSQIYGEQDVSLISSLEVNTSLSSSSYIEYFIYDNNQNLLSSDYNFKEYAVVNDGQSAGNNGDISQIVIDPEASLVNYGFDQGEYITYFNFLNKQIGSDLQQLYITEISSDRTEIRLDSTSLTDIDIVEQTNNLIVQRENSPYFLDFYLNFGDNQLPIANNIQLDNTDSLNPTILIKLYEALPEEFDLNSTLWVVTLVEEPIAYKVTFADEIFTILDTVPVKGPNFNLDLKDQVNNSTISYDYSSLTLTSLSSSQNQLKSLLEEKEIDINVDYTDFNNFIHFSSAQTRLDNFYYKVSLIEQYSSSIATLNNTTNNNPNDSIAIYEAKISDIITNFDGYDYYLYYSSGSSSWPKTTNEPPYLLAKTNSLAVSQWFGSSVEGATHYGGISLSASNFDNLNQNNLYYSIPEYLRDDSANDQYSLFIEMVGQFYDNIWIYYKDVTEKYNADNRLENGISKDIVADAIRDFGIKLYQNNFSNEDLYTAFLGLTPDGALFPFPNITGSLPTPTGFEYVDTLISASNDYMPLDDVNKSLYKRIYHNLPYLLKAKGTLPALRTLITSYGIPDTILRINEYGGKDKVNSNDWDYWQNEFNYSILTDSVSPCVVTKFNALNNLWGATNETPEALMLRFKLATTDHKNGDPSETVFLLDSGTELSLLYTGSGLSSGSYSGSIIDPYYQYASLNFYPDPSDLSISASVYLPFYNQDWWSVMINAVHNGSNIDYTLYAANKVYEGGDNGTKLGFFASSSVSSPKEPWIDSNQALYGRPMSGSFQEIRYYVNPISESVFKDYVMNPSSIEGNSLNSGPNELAFRASLGGELYTGSVSIHPKVTGSWETTSSFDGASGFEINSIFTTNTEYFFYDQPVAGIKNAISDKIRLENDTLPAGNTLSSIRALSQQPSVSSSYTANTNLLEVAFSPQDEINEDIMDQIGYFNIGEYIGDPRLRSSSAESYPALDNLRDDYFEKYTKNYDLNDFMRLIKFFDNSLFKMIKDFVPARTSLASGIVIKQHLLERNKYPQPQTDINSTIAYGSSGSVNNIPLVFQDISVSGTIPPQWNDYTPGTIENFSGGTGGSFERFNYVSNTSQSWYESVPTIYGSVLIFHNNQDEFYDGEFSGSMITVTTQSLHTPYPLHNISSPYNHVYYYGITKLTENIFLNNFLSNNTSPKPGEILFLSLVPRENFYYNIPTQNIYKTKYIKIAKKDYDGNNNSLILGQITELYVYNPNKAILFPQDNSSHFDKYIVSVINEYSDCYLYETNENWNIIDNIGGWGDPHDNQVFDYTISSSLTASYSVGNGSPKTIVNWNSTLVGTNLPHYNTPYFNTSSGIFTFLNTPNIPLIFSSSITSSGTGFPGSSYPIYLIQNRNNTENIVAQQFYNTLGTTNILLTASLYPIQGDQYYISLTKPGTGGNITITNANIHLYQEWDNYILDTFYSPSTSSYASSIFEPYITTPNYYNSNDNPTINNINNDRLSTIYEDVDYSTNITTPSNFDLIISGSALKASVQDSNYSSKRVTLPRYDGSKSTSQYLNVWTPGDEGTYGKLPSVESLKNAVAYCDSISGWTPERMNASALMIRYLIKSDGTIIVPNTTPNSLDDNKGIFETGENIEIQYENSGKQVSPIRKVIRGGTRIEPILYSQYGSAPGALWNTTMSFTDIIPSNTGVTGNYTATFTKNSSQTISNPSTPTKITFNNAAFGSSYFNNTNDSYVVPLGAITDGVNLIFNPSIKIYASKLNLIAISNTQINIIATLKLYKGSTYQGISQNFPITISPLQSSITQTLVFSSPIEIPTTNLAVGDEYSLYIEYTTSLPGLTSFRVEPNTLFTTQQYPIAISPITSSGTNTLWGWPNKTTYPNIITSSNPTLGNPDVYGNPNVKAVNITGSGFNEIQLPWSIEYGDEFRFEGREDFVYQVAKVFSPSDSGSGRLFQTGSIEVHFNSPLPVDANSTSFNLDHFLIRRYVNDATSAIIEGFAPADSTGPYIIKPEFVVPELDRDLDSFILDLTQKGLLT